VTAFGLRVARASVKRPNCPSTWAAEGCAHWSTGAIASAGLAAAVRAAKE